MKRFFTPVGGSSEGGKRTKGDATGTSDASLTPSRTPKTFMTWNCNSLLGRLRSSFDLDRKSFAKYVTQHTPDVIALQETWLPARAPDRRGALSDEKKYAADKVLIETFLRQAPFNDYKAYWACSNMKRAGSGVLVKKDVTPPLRVTRSLVSTKPEDAHAEGRVLLLEFDSLVILNVYAQNNGWTPESMAKRREWDEELRGFLVGNVGDESNPDWLTRPRFGDSAKGSGTTLIASGTVLTINGLVKRGDLNGTQCEVVGFDSDRERYRVKVLKETHEELYVKPANLTGDEKAQTNEGTTTTSTTTPGKRKPLIWTGDLNACHREVDVTHPTFFLNQKAEGKKGKPAAPLPADVNDRGQPGFTVNERKRFDSLVMDAELVDAYRHLHGDKENAMTWFGHPGNERVGKYKGKGMRLDYFFLDEELTESIKECTQATDPFDLQKLSERPDDAFFGSDHAAVLLRLK